MKYQQIPCQPAWRFGACKVRGRGDMGSKRHQFCARRPRVVSAGAGVAAKRCIPAQSHRCRRPMKRQECPSGQAQELPDELITPTGRLDLVAHDVRQRSLGNLCWETGVLGYPVPESAAQAVDSGGHQAWRPPDARCATASWPGYLKSGALDAPEARFGRPLWGACPSMWQLILRTAASPFLTSPQGAMTSSLAKQFLRG